MKRPAIFAFLVLTVVGAFLTITAGGPPQPALAGGARPMVGFRAPPFTLQTLGGKRVSLAAERGKPVLINFWATWCPPCRVEMPQIERFQRMEGNRVAILGVNAGEPAAVVSRFVGRYGFGWTFVLDPGETTAADYRVRAFPTSFFVDRRGIIRQIYSGPMDVAQMRSFLRQTEAAR